MKPLKTFATLFSGGELAGVGLSAAGLSHLWGVEYDPEIASVAERNGFPLIVGDVCSVDYESLARADWLHMSPVCKNASLAKTGSREEKSDLDTARACARAIAALQPEVVTLENVWMYRRFESFALILRALTAAGYYADFWRLNAADYGVPQTRQRLIMIARRDGWPTKPTPTHHKVGSTPDAQLSLFAPTTSPWVGWYAAIEDLIDTLPASEFAPWQLRRLPPSLLRDYGVTRMVNSSNAGRPMTILAPDQPSFTIDTAQTPRAFIADGVTSSKIVKTTVRTNDDPMFTVTANIYKGMPRSAILTRQPSVGQAPRRAAGRVVKMTTRALARFQSVPDTYVLPDRVSLACTVIGNGVPSLLMQRVAESVRDAA